MYTEILGSILQSGLENRCCICFQAKEDEMFSLDCDFEEFGMKSVDHLLKERCNFDFKLYSKETEGTLCPTCLENLQNCCRFMNSIDVSKEILKCYLSTKANIQKAFEGKQFIRTSEVIQVKAENDSQDSTREVIVSSPSEEVSKIEIESPGLIENLYLNAPDSTLEIVAQIEESDVEESEDPFKQEFTFDCKNCLESGFESMEQLAVHRKTVHGVKFPYQCDKLDCLAMFKTLAELKNHKSSKSEKLKKIRGPKTFTCEICSKVWPKFSALERHMKSHGGEKEFFCEICFKGFALKSGLYSHRIVHERTLKFECDKCGRKYMRKEDLKYHLRIHFGVLPFQCRTCFKRFNKNSNLVKHYLTHTGEKPFTCDICGLKLRTKMHLKVHREKHDDQIKYFCHEKVKRGGVVKVCNRGFKHITNLNIHKKIHLGLKFRCEFPGCNKEFTRKEKVKVHFRVHTQETPYHCLTCDAAFRTLPMLKCHQKNHDPEFRRKSSKN